MAAKLFFTPIPAVLSRGLPSAGAKVCFYLSGTLTKAPIYSDSALSVTMSNPVVADGSGSLPAIYLNDAITYRLRITDSSDVLIPGCDIDPYTPGTLISLQGLQGIPGISAYQLAVSNGFVGTMGQWLLTLVGGGVTGVAYYSTRAALGAISSPVTGQSANLSEPGREGLFVWSGTNHSADVTADPNQGLYVPPAGDATGASGAWLRVYVKGFANVKWFNAKGDGSTDDTVAIQNALNLLSYLGGGTLFFPDGTYIIAGALQDTGASNSQIVWPKINPDENSISIRLMGMTPPMLNGAGLSGAILLSTLGTGNGQMIGCKNTANSAFQNATWCGFAAENITFRMQSNPTNSCLDFSCMTVVTFSGNVRVDVVGGFSTVSGQPSVATAVQPTTASSYGIKGPLTDTPLWSNYDNLMIFGYYTGMRNGELTNINNIAISCCWIAMEFPNLRHPSVFSRILILSCNIGLYCSAAGFGSEIYVFLLNLEHTTMPAWVLPRSADIYDTINGFRGNIFKIHMHEPSRPLQFLGATNLKYDIAITYPDSGSGVTSLLFPSFRSITSTSSVNELDGTPAALPWRSDVITQPSTSGSITAWSGSNFSVTGSDKRVGQIAMTCDGAVDSGAMYFGTGKAGTLTNRWKIDCNGFLVCLALAEVPNAANDAAAAALSPPVPVGGVYRNANALQIRLV